MKRLSVLIWLLLSPFALAQTVKVKSGDHSGFTRLVLELPKAVDWQLGRTAEGYALQLQDKSVQFDVTTVFDDIQRNRLAAIWTDPVSGALRFGVACACHAIPFEFRPGIIVVDLRDGPPPKGSSFELALDGSGASDLTQKPPTRPRAKPKSTAVDQTAAGQKSESYNWLASTPPAAKHQTTDAHTMTVPSFVDVTDLTPLKEALLRQLSQGAAQGIVQMQQPKLQQGEMVETVPLGPRANVRIGDVPGFLATTRRPPDQRLIKDGTDCISSDVLDLRDWATDQSIASQLAENRSNLVGEFDRPNPDGVTRAVKFLIYFGFGAEARQLLAEMPIDHRDASLWNSMAKLVDGKSDIDGPFAEMQTCDTAAALWAVLAMPQLAKGQPLHAGAVVRAFSALPPHLRQYLGPALSAKFLAIGEIETSQSVGNAALRGAAETGASLAIMTATMEMAKGDHSAASADLQPTVADAGPATAEVLIALVDAKIAAGEPIGPDVALALAAFAHEQKGSPLEPALQRAEILALGSSGDFDQAFSLLPMAPTTEADLWKLLAKSGSDTATITHAVLPATAKLPPLTSAQRHEIASHLLALGLPDAALVWIGPFNDDLSTADKILAAKAQLSRNEPAVSLMWIEGIEDDDAAELKAQAFGALGQTAEAALAWAKAGNSEAEMRAQSWAQDWQAVSTRDASPWQAAAAIVAGDTPQAPSPPPGPLAVGNALIAESASVRAALADLLATVSGP
jgi:hypothetical protein